MGRPPEFEVLYDPDRARQNANIPGALVGPLAGMVADAVYENDEGKACGVPDELLENHPYLGFVQNVLELTRSVGMKGSEQIVRSLLGIQQAQMEGSGVAPNLTPNKPAMNEVHSPVVLAVNGSKELYRDLQGGKRKRFGFGR